MLRLSAPSRWAGKRDLLRKPRMGNGLIKCDLTLDKYFTYGQPADVITRPVLPRREGQPILMRGEVSIKDDGGQGWDGGTQASKSNAASV